jgi:3-dehydroquinate synthase
MPHYKIVKVNLVRQPYSIYIGEDLLQQVELISPHVKGQQIFIVCDDNTKIYLPRLTSALANFDCNSLILPAGEQYKTLETCNRIWTALMQKYHDRSTILCALGGGVIGDLTGFAAACYRRGVAFLQYPTTLLAQVDAAIGGKTGVNHPMGKNMIGAFHQPQCVVIDINTLHTLPEREFIAGLAEVVKYGLIADVEFFNWLEANVDQIRTRDVSALTYIIEQSCAIKARFVALDEFEEGPRALLNLGHTFAHAIETATSYQGWLHGEAVSVGIALAADLSWREGLLNSEDVSRIQCLLQALGLPIKPPSDMSSEQFLSLMAQDKKVLARQLRLVLLQKIGAAFVTSDFSKENLQQTLAEL